MCELDVISYRLSYCSDSQIDQRSCANSCSNLRATLRIFIKFSYFFSLAHTCRLVTHRHDILAVAVQASARDRAIVWYCCKRWGGGDFCRRCHPFFADNSTGSRRAVHQMIVHAMNVTVSPVVYSNLWTIHDLETRTSSLLLLVGIPIRRFRTLSWLRIEATHPRSTARACRNTDLF